MEFAKGRFQPIKVDKASANDRKCWVPGLFSPLEFIRCSIVEPRLKAALTLLYLHQYPKLFDLIPFAWQNLPFAKYHKESIADRKDVSYIRLGFS
jgi:hypothetical protein